MTLTDVRAGLGAIGDQLDHFDHAGKTYWHGPSPSPEWPPKPRGHLLIALDEYHNGYQDSRHLLDLKRIVPGGRRGNIGMALVDGQMVGGLRRTIRKDEVSFEVDLFRDLDTDEFAALEEAAERQVAFLDRDSRLVLTT